MRGRYMGVALVMVLHAGCTAAYDAGGTTDADVTEKTEQASHELSCTNPVKADDTAKSIMDRYGDAAKLEILAGPEGFDIPGIVLWPDDPARRVVVGFDDEARTQISFIEVDQAGSVWRLSGLKIGDTLNRVRKANGAPVKFLGFEWDYSGTVMSFTDGTFDKIKECQVQMRLTYDFDNFVGSDKMIGDMEVSSDFDFVDQRAISIAAMGIGFPRE